MILHDIVRDEGCAVLLVTHDPRVEDVANRILWLEDGALPDRRAEKHSWVSCPVCHMRVDEWTAEWLSEYHEKRYIFCSERCQQRFVASPSEFTEGLKTAL